MKFPPHFTIEELTRSQTATRNGIDNTPEDLSNLMRPVIFMEVIFIFRRLSGANGLEFVGEGA